MPPDAPVRAEKRVRVRPDTEPKLAAITARMRWTDTEALDALCDEFIAQHGISVTDAAQAPAEQQNEVGGALIHAPTADSLAQSEQGSDMQSNDASTIKPTAGRPRRSANSGKAQDAPGESRETPLEKAG